MTEQEFAKASDLKRDIHRDESQIKQLDERLAEGDCEYFGTEDLWRQYMAQCRALILARMDASVKEFQSL